MRQSNSGPFRRETHREDGTRALPSYRLLLQLWHKSQRQASKIYFQFSSANSSIPIRLVAAEAGFFPPGPCVVFADMLDSCEARLQMGRKCRGRGVAIARLHTGRREVQMTRVVVPSWSFPSSGASPSSFKLNRGTKKWLKKGSTSSRVRHRKTEKEQRNCASEQRRDHTL